MSPIHVAQSLQPRYSNWLQENRKTNDVFNARAFALQYVIGSNSQIDMIARLLYYRLTVS